MKKITLSELERRILEKVPSLSATELEKDFGFEKINRDKMATLCLGILSHAKRIEPIFHLKYSKFNIITFINDIFDGNLPYRVGIIKYTLPRFGSRWIDIFVRPTKKNYKPVKYVLFKRIGIHQEGDLVAPSKFEDFLLS